MDLSLSNEQMLLKDSFRRLFEKKSSIARVREAAPLGFDRSLWDTLVDMGTPMMLVSAETGGLGLSLHDAALVADEAGRQLASAPLIEVMIAAGLIARSGIGAAWLEALANGSAIVGFAPIPAKHGVAEMVPGGAVADAIVALDRDELVLVASSRRRKAAANIGQLPLADWPLAGTDNGEIRVVLARGAAAVAAFQAAHAQWQLLGAACLAGMAEQALRLAAAYASERSQFGRPIGSFQGLSHPLADSFTDVDGGRLLAWKAIWAIARGEPEAEAMAPLAWWWAGQSAIMAVRRATRALGGYGLSIEYDLQLYNRRANALALSCGDPQAELRVAADRLYTGTSAALPNVGEIGVDFSLGDAGQRHADRMTSFFRANWDERMQAKAHHSTRSHDRDFHRKLGEAGLLFASWPREHGGDAISGAEEFAGGNVFEDWNYTTHVIQTTGLTAEIVMRYGSTEVQAEVLPRIKRGEVVCSLGFSEPSSGSDVFAARLSAVRDGDHWLLNGQKMFTTAGHYADYVIVLARTDPGEAKHRGLTLFLVPTALPGYSFQPVETYQDERTNITYYTDMRVPDRYRIGPVDEGGAVMAAALAIEHGGESYFRGQMRMMRSLTGWAGAGEPGERPIDDPAIRTRMARIRARYEVASCFVARGVWAGDSGQFNRSWGPMAKMFITETFLQSCWEILEMGGAKSPLIDDGPLSMIELDHRRAYGMTIYGGANEIHRSLIAEQALGLPKSRN